MSVKMPERHVHFATDQVSGSHRPPEAFRTKHVVAGPAKTPDSDRIFTIRPGVPFDAWFIENKHTADVWQKRGGAVVALAKGMCFALVDLVRSIFAAIFYKSSEEQFSDLKAQWHGLQLSASAIYSPDSAREQFLKYWEDPANRDVPLTFFRY